MKYFDELCRTMTMLAEQHSAVFLGQAVKYDGTAMFSTLREVPAKKRFELPVAENMQLGMCTGISIAGGLAVAIFPRINFLLEAASQLIQHLDKLPLYSDGGYRPRVIIRTAVANPEPLNPGEQHLGDHSWALEEMLDTVKVVRLWNAADIVPAYRAAAEADHSTLLVEYAARYGD